MSSVALPEVGPRRLTRSVLAGALISGVSALAHGVNGHSPSPTLMLISCVLCSAALMPFMGNTPDRRPSYAAGTALLLLGQVCLHAWFGWFAMPAAALPGMAIDHQHHTAALVGDLPARDFGVLLPSGSMLAAHALTALVLSVVLLKADALNHVATELLHHFLRPLRMRATVTPSQSTSPIGVNTSVVVVPQLFHEVISRRGPPLALAR